LQLAPRKSSARGRFCSLLLLCLCLGLFHSTRAPAEGPDNELWLDQNFFLTLSPKTTLHLHLVERFNQNVSKFFQGYAALGLQWEVTDWLRLTPRYRHQRENPFGFAGEQVIEHRPQFDIELHRRWGPWGAILRTRFAWRQIEHQPGFLRIRLRPQVQLSLPLAWKRRPAVFVSEEIFYEFGDVDKLNRNRLRAGISFPVSAHLTLAPYYMVESKSLPTGWDHDNVWGLTLGWRF